MPEVRPPFRDGVYVLPVRVYYEDTDAAGIVYYANYFRFAERARTEMLIALGVRQEELLNGHGVAFAVRHCSADYVKPARFGDLLEVHSRIIGMARTSITAEQSVRRDGTELVAMTFRIVCMTLGGRAVRIPDHVRAALADVCVAGKGT